MSKLCGKAVKALLMDKKLNTSKSTAII
ncbi:hypothetical protein ACLK1S_02740 [Escherichia coli]